MSTDEVIAWAARQDPFDLCEWLTRKNLMAPPGMPARIARVFVEHGDGAPAHLGLADRVLLTALYEAKKQGCEDGLVWHVFEEHEP